MAHLIPTLGFSMPPSDDGGDGSPSSGDASSLQNAIKLDWEGTSGFSTAIGPLYFDQAPAKARAPYVVMSHPQELPGETADDNAAQIWFLFYAGGAAESRRLGKLFIAWVSRLEEVLSDREPYAWETGIERGNLVDVSQPIKVPRRDPVGDDLYRYTVLVRFLIEGRP